MPDPGGQSGSGGRCGPSTQGIDSVEGVDKPAIPFVPRVFPGLCGHFVAFVIETTQEFGAAFADGPAAVVVVVLIVVLRRAIEHLELFLAMIAARFIACRGDSILAHGRQGQVAGGNAVQQFVEAPGIGAGRIVAYHGVAACR